MPLSYPDDDKAGDRLCYPHPHPHDLPRECRIRILTFTINVMTTLELPCMSDVWAAAAADMPHLYNGAMRPCKGEESSTTRTSNKQTKTQAVNCHFYQPRDPSAAGDCSSATLCPRSTSTITSTRPSSPRRSTRLAATPQAGSSQSGPSKPTSNSARPLASRLQS